VAICWYNEVTFDLSSVVAAVIAGTRVDGPQRAAAKAAIIAESTPQRAGKNRI